MRVSLIPLVALLAVLLPAASLPLSAAVPTLVEGLNLESVSRPEISPDGHWVVYQRQQTDWKENAYVDQLWLADAAGTKNFQLTRGKKSAEHARWSPDGRWIAFMTERESGAVEPKKPDADESKEEKEKEPGHDGKPEARQIWLISPTGGEAWMLTKHSSRISDFVWSRDGKAIAFLAPEPESKAAKTREKTYSKYQVVERDFEQNQIWTVDVATAEKRQLPVEAQQVTGDPALNVESIDWSPDGHAIAFDATPDPLLAHGGESDIYLVDLTRKNAVRRIVALPGPDGNPLFSPDGTSLAFNTSLGAAYYFYTNQHIAAVKLAKVLQHEASSPSDVEDLTASFDEDASPIDWDAGGIHFIALQKTTSHLFRIEPSTREISRLTEPDQLVVRAASFTPDGRTLAYAAPDATHLTEIYVSALSPFRPAPLTDMTSQVKGWTLGTTEVVSWKSRDGAMIEGVLHKPADFDPHRKYPLLVVIHGGPTGISLPLPAARSHYYPIEQFLAKGALVLEPNYRGSAGYGSAFRALNVRNLGVGDMWDVMSGVDALIDRGMVDPKRLGSMGWSEGGYISAFLTTNTNRFEAISVGAGISDWMTYYVNTDITPFTRQYLHATPWDDPEIYAKTSPITTIRNASTPTLIQHGGNDARVPIPNGYELYRGLRDEKVPVTMVVYPGFGHPITKPKSNLAVLQTNLDWFSHYIWGEPIPDASPLRGRGERNTEAK
ncbi:MAG: S9 family peptidase [Thermoanaerobaculia bacterium]